MQVISDRLADELDCPIFFPYQGLSIRVSVWPDVIHVRDGRSVEPWECVESQMATLIHAHMVKMLRAAPGPEHSKVRRIMATWKASRTVLCAARHSKEMLSLIRCGGC